MIRVIDFGNCENGRKLTTNRRSLNSFSIEAKPKQNVPLEQRAQMLRTKLKVEEKKEKRKYITEKNKEEVIKKGLIIPSLESSQEDIF